MVRNTMTRIPKKMPPRASRTVDLCARWLLALLKESNEPMKPSEIVAIGKKEGYGRRTIYRARRRLGSEIANTAELRHNPDNKWELPSDTIDLTGWHLHSI